MKRKKFKTTWCDYLTKCFDRPGIQVGSFECHQCPFCDSVKEKESEYYTKVSQEVPVNYAKYTMIKSEGIVKCKFGENENE